MKYIRIAVAGSIDNPISFLIHRGVTARQVLSTLRLKEYVLFTLPTHEQPASPFLSPMDVYPAARSAVAAALFKYGARAHFWISS